MARERVAAWKGASGGDGGGANVDADSRGKREDAGRKGRGGKQGEQRVVVREKVERGSGARESWRASMAKESGDGEQRDKGGT